MKSLKIVAIGAFFCLSYYCSTAQERKIPVNQPDYNKPRLFTDLPGKMNLKISDMESLFRLPVGTPVTADISGDFNFKGTVVSKSDDRDTAVQSVVIRSTNRQGAVFTFTKIRNSDGNYVYKGRILSKNNSDAFDIIKENDQYVLQKKNYHDIVSE